jgi:hypothetical protein
VEILFFSPIDADKTEIGGNPQDHHQTKPVKPDRQRRTRAVDELCHRVMITL